MTPKRDDWIYLAGFVDGEGCIGSSQQRRKSNGVKREIWRPFLTISQMDHVVLQELYECFEVGVLWLNRTNNCLRWRIDPAEDLRWILQGLLPYLRLKKSQAEVAIRLLDNRADRSAVVELSALKKHRTIER